MGIYKEIVKDLVIDYKKRNPDWTEYDFSEHLVLLTYRAGNNAVLPDPLADSEEAWQATLNSEVPVKNDPVETFLSSFRLNQDGDERIIKIVERSTFYWLGKIFRMHFLDLMNLVEKIRVKGWSNFYRLEWQDKKGGGFRQLQIPNRQLMGIQTKINEKLLRDLPRYPQAFCFSGGRVIDALRPHLKFGSLLKLDIKKAFPSITAYDVRRGLTFGRKIKPVEKLQNIEDYGHFSWYLAKIICDLCVTSSLPQGAPTSGRLFDLAFYPLDVELSKLLKAAGGNYTRFADNLFFSVSERFFPSELKNSIKIIITGEKRNFLKLRYHKLWITNKRYVALRALGLNTLNGRLRNTKAFKSRLRKAMHHKQRLSELGLDTEAAQQKIGGLMGFAVKETLPNKLLKKTEQIKKDR
ncbi:hypothetical protein K8R32_03945 [bacterium]|nr:hypothetical protein [bacterium]